MLGAKEMSIIIQDIVKEYDGLKVLDGTSLEIPDGSSVCIMGESGSGKTTLMRIIMGLEKADSGSIYGVPDKISAVFQEDRLCNSFSSLVNIRIAAKKSDREIIRCLTALGLGEKKQYSKPVGKLSGGMRRRVAIARALLFDAPLIIFDEPFKGLDAQTKSNVINFILQSTAGKTLIFVTHSIEEAKLLGAGIIKIDCRDNNSDSSVI